MTPLLKITLSLLLLTILTSSLSFSQNDLIIEELKKDKEERTEKKSSGGSYSSSGGSATKSTYSSSYKSNCSSSSTNSIDGLVFLVGAFVYCHESAMEQYKNNHRDIVSLEGSFHAGYYSKYRSILLVPQLRANYGMFSSEVRYQRIDDNRFILESLDWQILKFNIVASPFKMSFGMGFSKLTQVAITYFEWSVNSQLRFYKNKFVAEAGYRSAGEFRKEARFTLDYEISEYTTGKAKFHLSPMIGLVYHNYFLKYDQYYAVAGLNVRFF